MQNNYKHAISQHVTRSLCMHACKFVNVISKKKSRLLFLDFPFSYASGLGGEVDTYLINCTSVALERLGILFLLYLLQSTKYFTKPSSTSRLGKPS